MIVIFLLTCDASFIFAPCHFLAPMITDSQNFEWKTMDTEETKKKMEKNLIFQFKTTNFFFLDLFRFITFTILASFKKFSSL